MVNVLRVFNDSTGVVSLILTVHPKRTNQPPPPLPTTSHAQELTQRTGKNPNYQYVQIGCSSKATAAMMQFARAQVGKPFSSTGMFRSMVWPRTTDFSSFYCAELVASCLRTGGLMSRDSNPGAATPYSLYKLYKAQGAVMANPCTLRQQFGAMPTRPLARPLSLAAPPPQPACYSAAPLPAATTFRLRSAERKSATPNRRMSDSPPRMPFKTLQQRGACDSSGSQLIELSLTSLSMDRRL